MFADSPIIAYAIAQMKQGGFLDDVTPSAELFGIPAHSDEPITVPSTESQREVWLAADHSKFNRPAMITVARLPQIDRLFTDAAVPEPFPALMREAQVRCHVAAGKT